MNTGQKVFTWLWTIFATIVLVFLVYSDIRTQAYSGTDLKFPIEEDWDMEIQSNSPINIQMASSSYFEISNKEMGYLSGALVIPPLNNIDRYYYLEDQIINGRWDTHINDCSARLTSNENIEVSLYATTSFYITSIAVHLILGLIVWGLILFCFLGLTGYWD